MNHLWSDQHEYNEESREEMRKWLNQVSARWDDLLAEWRDEFRETNWERVWIVCKIAVVVAAIWAVCVAITLLVPHA